MTCKSDPDIDKCMRVAAKSVKFESGRVYLPIEAPWLEDYVRELILTLAQPRNEARCPTVLGTLAGFVASMRRRYSRFLAARNPGRSN